MPFTPGPSGPQGAVPWVARPPPDYANLEVRKHLEREDSQKGVLISQGKPASSLAILPKIYCSSSETCPLPPVSSECHTWALVRSLFQIWQKNQFNFGQNQYIFTKEAWILWIEEHFLQERRSQNIGPGTSRAHCCQPALEILVTGWCLFLHFRWLRLPTQPQHGLWELPHDGSQVGAFLTKPRAPRKLSGCFPDSLVSIRD